jgi:PAS domain S-box-containing protein
MGERETGSASGLGAHPRATRSRLDLWIPGLYAGVSAIWIAFSDALIAAAAPSIQDMEWWSTAKGFGFVAITTAGLHLGLRWAIARERRVEGALRRIESRYDLLAQHARDIVLVLRREDGRILEANAAAAAAYGWSREALRGMTVYQLRAPGDAALVAAQLAAANAGTRFEAVHHRKDGSTFPVEVNSQGVELDGERVLGTARRRRSSPTRRGSARWR